MLVSRLTKSVSMRVRRNETERTLHRARSGRHIRHVVFENLEHVCESSTRHISHVNQLSFCDVHWIETFECELHFLVFEIWHCQRSHIFVLLEVAALFFGDEKKIVEEEAIAIFTLRTCIIRRTLQLNQTSSTKPNQRKTEKRGFPQHRNVESKNVSNMRSVQLYNSMLLFI